MITLRQVPPEYTAHCDIKEELEGLLEQVVITGNRDFIDCGDKALIDIIKGDYYDDDCGYDYDAYDELRKVTGKRWERTVIRGHCQSDWQYLYYPIDELAYRDIVKIENFYMGKVTEFIVDEMGSYFVPDDIVWKGKQAICDYLGLPVDDITILEPTTRHVVYDYEQMQ